MKKQLKNTIRAYLCTIMLVVYIIGVVTIAQGTNHTWQGILVILTGVGIMAIMGIILFGTLMVLFIKFIILL